MGNDILLEKFMKEFFPWGEFKAAGVFTKEMKGDYVAQSNHICKMLGLKSIYEYGAKEIRCHLSYENNKRPLLIYTNGKMQEEPFITVIESIYN
jgi:hypothetical protein